MICYVLLFHDAVSEKVGKPISFQVYFLLIQTLSLHPTLGDKINVSNEVLSHSIDFETQGILVLDEILFGVFPNRVDKDHAYYAIYYNYKCSSRSSEFVPE